MREPSGLRIARRQQNRNDLHAAERPPGRAVHIELLRELQLARTFPPMEPMTAIAATTIRPAISAYSKTSPPDSSRINDLIVFMFSGIGSRREVVHIEKRAGFEA